MVGVVAVGVALAVLLGAWIYLGILRANSDGGTVSSGPPDGGNNTTYVPPTPTVVVPAGSHYDLAPRGHQDVAFAVNNSSQLSGPVTCTVSIEVFVMTTAQYQAYTAGGTPSGVYSSGAVKSTFVHVSLAPGSYELVILNPSSTMPAIVQIPGPIQYD